MNKLTKAYRTLKYKEYYRIVKEQQKDLDQMNQYTMYYRTRVYPGIFSYLFRLKDKNKNRQATWLSHSLEGAYKTVIARQKENKEKIEEYNVMSNKDVIHAVTLFLLKEGINESEDDIPF
jgi:hypothetical protein